jgi:molecular chaperone GrpE (heat shock protein)
MPAPSAAPATASPEQPDLPPTYDPIYSEAAADFAALLASVQTRLEHLEELFEGKIRDDDRQRQLFERLMKELEEYRQDFIYSHVTSKVFRDLIQLYDTLEQTLHSNATEEISREALRVRMGSFHQQVVRILQRQEVELIESAPGKPFDEQSQEAIDVCAVERPEEDGIVVEIVRRGFRYRERLLRPEWVVVGKYQNR